MLLADSVYTPAVQTLDFMAVGCLQRREHRDITGLELVGGVIGEATETDVVSKAVLENFERFVCAEAVADQQARFPVCPLPSLRIEHACEPLEA